MQRVTSQEHWLIRIIVNRHLVIRNWIGKFPFLFYSVAKLLSRLGAYGWSLNHPVARSTDICVEGFRSSANTFFAYMFSQCNDVNIGHHQHVVAQIRRAREYGVPVVVLIRSPIDVVASWISRSPNYSATTLLRCYADFYDSVSDCAGGELVAVRFETIVQEKDFDAIIEAINEEFGTSFSSFDEEQDVLKMEDEFFNYAESTSTKPSRSRERAKRKLKASIRDNPWLPRARETYERFLCVNPSV